MARSNPSNDATMTPGMSKAMQEAADRARANTLRAEYLSKLTDFADGTGFMGTTLPLNMASLKWLTDRKNAEASHLVEDEAFKASTQRLETYLLHTMKDGNVEDFRKWFVPVRKKVRSESGKKIAPKILALFMNGLDDNNTQERLLKELLTGNPAQVLGQALVQFEGGDKYTGIDEQFTLFTAIAALQPGLVKGNRHEERAEKLINSLLSRTAADGAEASAKQLTDLDIVGDILRRRAREDINVVSADVISAVVANAKSPAFQPVRRKWIPFTEARTAVLNDISPTPVNAIDAIGSVIMGSHLRLPARSRAFLRFTDAGVVRPHLLKSQADDLVAANALRDRSIAEEESKANAKLTALDVRKTRGFRVFMARQKYVGGLFAGFAAARASRIQSMKEDVASQRNQLRKKAHVEASKQRVLMFRENLQLGASLTVFHNGKKRQKLRAGHGESLFHLVKDGLHEATIGESASFLATAAEVLGGLPQREQGILAQPVVYEPIMDKGLTAEQHTANLLALASGIQRAPKALPAYMQALFLKGQLIDTVVHMQGMAEAGDKRVRREAALMAQALGATYKAFKGTVHEAEFEKAQTSFAASIAPEELNERYLKGCRSGMDDFSRGDEAVRKTRRVSMRMWRRITAKRPARTPANAPAVNTAQIS